MRLTIPSIGLDAKLNTPLTLTLSQRTRSKHPFFPSTPHGTPSYTRQYRWYCSPTVPPPPPTCNSNLSHRHRFLATQPLSPSQCVCLQAKNSTSSLKANRRYPPTPLPRRQLCQPLYLLQPLISVKGCQASYWEAPQPKRAPINFRSGATRYPPPGEAVTPHRNTALRKNG